MKFGILFNKENEKAKELFGKIADFLKKQSHDVVDEKNISDSDVIITLGGDGTLIHKACEHAELGIPFVGINTGNLGFLTAEEADDWQKAIKKLTKKDYFVSERITLEANVKSAKAHPRGVPGESQAHLGGGAFRAVNEVVVRGLYRAIDLEVKVGGEKFLKVLGDGVIVATQTGSTAYSLSAGGPIVDPDLDSILITPINPIGLPIPSAVLSPDDPVEVVLIRGDDISLVLDGQEHTKLSQGDRVKVKSGKVRIKFIYFDKHQFLKSLNAKFGLSNRSVKDYD